MMNVQIMRYIVDPLNTGEMPSEVQLAVERWRGELPAYVRSSANHIFSFTRSDKTYYLRLAHELERNQKYIQAELDFILHCASAGLVVARPVLSTNGVYIEAISSDEGRYYAVAFEGLQGNQYETDELNPAMYRAWGRTLARLHHASKSFSAHSARPTWQEEIRPLLKTLPPKEHVLAHILDSGLVWLNKLPVQDFGLIHGDFELDNLVWEGEHAQILDFDAAMYTWYAVDIAIALQDVYLSSGLAREERLMWFFEGYMDVYPLSRDTQEHMRHFSDLLLAVKVARLLRSYATTHDDIDYPDWLVTMRNRHQNWLITKRALLNWD